MRFVDILWDSEKTKGDMYNDILRKFGTILIKDYYSNEREDSPIKIYDEFYDFSRRNRLALLTAMDVFMDNYGSEILELPEIVKDYASHRRLRTNVGYTLNDYRILSLNRENKTVKFLDYETHDTYEIPVKFLSEIFLKNLVFMMTWIYRIDILEILKENHRLHWFGKD